MKILLTLFVLFFLNACIPPNKSNPIVIEGGSTRYLENNSAWGNDIDRCELMCIGNRNFPTAHNNAWERGSISIKYNSGKNQGNEVVNVCTDYKKEVDWDSISQQYKNPERIYSCAASTELYQWAGITGKDNKNAVCRPFNKSNSEVLEIKFILEECNSEATWSRKQLVKKHQEQEEYLKKLFEENKKKKYDDIIATCDKLGFKKGTESNGNCVLEIIKTQKELAEIAKKKSEPPQKHIIIQKENNLNSSLLLMQMGLNLISPPRPQLNCRFVFNTMQCY